MDRKGGAVPAWLAPRGIGWCGEAEGDAGVAGHGEDFEFVVNSSRTAGCCWVEGDVGQEDGVCS